MKNSKLVLVILLSFFSFTGIAQEYLMDGSPITDCQGSFFDSGGNDAGYQPGESFSTLICSDNTTTDHIRLNFFDFDLGEGDELLFYDGTTADPTTQIIPALTSSGLPFSIQSTVANSSGCILVVFNSDGFSEGRGWRADINCTGACQTIINAAVTDPPADGVFIDICPGDTVNLTAIPAFPQNGLLYPQSTADCTYFWYFSDGESGNGQQIDRVFEQPGGHRVRLDVVDQMGCTNTNFIDLVVRVAPSPAFILSDILDTTYCWGDTIVLHTLLSELPEVPGLGIFPVPVYETSGLTLADSLLLPDGSGGVYEQSLFLDSYPSGLTFGELSDFQGIYFNMEHSYSGDLDIEVICPNGTEVYILDYPAGVGSTNFGEPFATDRVDGLSADITPGIGYDYYFIDGAVNGTLEDFDPFAPDYTYTTVPSIEDDSTYTYTDSYFPAGIYAPEDSFIALESCPMNGEWKVRVTDNLGLDNGWIFGWGFDNSPEVNVTIVDTITVESYGWEYDPAILLETLDSIVVLPEEIGLLALNFLIEDNYGCPADTTFMFSILSADDPECFVSNTLEPLEGEWQVYPNPTQTALTVLPDGPEDSWQYTIYNATGQVMRTGTHRGQLNVSTASWPASIYIVNVIQDSRQRSWKVIKE